MRYKRLLLILSIVVLFAFSALVFVAVFSVKDIDVTYSVYGETGDLAEEILSQYVGRNLLFVDEAEIADRLKSATALKVDFVEKVYPSTIKVSLSSRQERFAISDGAGGYYVADEEYAVVDKRSTAANSTDALDNIVVRLDVGESLTLAVGGELPIEEKPYLKAFKTVVESFSSPRDEICSVLIYQTAEAGNYRITVTLRQGVRIVVYKATEKTFQKINAGISKLSALTDAEKLDGKIECWELDGGSVTAVYTTH